MIPPSTILTVEATPRDLPLREPFAIATGAQLRAEVAVVAVTLASGHVGLGEAAPFPAVSGETRDRSLEAIRRVAAGLVGRDAREHGRLAHDLAEELPSEPAARAALEMAVLDAFARSVGAPLWAIWGGGGPPRFSTDLTITAGDVEHASRASAAAAAEGFDTLKVKVGAASPEIDLARVLAVHAAAPRARLVLDANGALSGSAARALLADLAARGVRPAAFEQPVAAEDLGAMAEVTRESGATRVVADESARSAADVARLAQARAAHAVNLKITKTGVAEAVAMALTARAAGLGLMIGGMVETEIAMGFSAHLVRGLGGFDLVDLDTPLFLDGRLSAGGVAFHGPRLEVGDAPGTGAALLPEAGRPLPGPT